MSNGWTGGQYSIFRAMLGAYLLAHFGQLFPYGAELFSNTGALPDASASPLLFLFPNVFALADDPVTVQLVLAIGCMLSIALVLGWRDRVAALGAWYILACLFGRNPLISNPSLPYVGLMLVLHALLPRAPFGSLSARGRSDPGGGWSFSEDVYLVAWILMALGYSYSGYTKLVSPSWLDGSAFARVLENPLARPTAFREWVLGLPPVFLKGATWGALVAELLFAPLALSARFRKWMWLAMALMHVGLVVLIDFADLSAAMLLLHFFTFDTAWVRAANPGPLEQIFYDGHCGLCHRGVRFVMAEDLPGGRFRLAPLQGTTFVALVPESQRAGLPDSIVVRRASGELLSRSVAMLYLMSRLGGLWRVAATGLGLVPTAILDVCYDAIARVRHRLFTRPEETCPLIPPVLRARFDP